MRKVTVVGVGALGSHIVLALRNSVQIRIIDFDRVEQKNTLSQFHQVSSVGKLKVLALQQLMNFLFKTRIEAISHKLTRDNIKELLSSSDIVIDAVDNGETRELIRDFCLSNKIPCLHSSISAEGDFSRVMWSDNFTVDYESKVGVPTCENGDHLPFIVHTASVTAMAAQNFLQTGKSIGYHIGFGFINTVTSSVVSHAGKKRENDK